MLKRVFFTRGVVLGILVVLVIRLNSWLALTVAGGVAK